MVNESKCKQTGGKQGRKRKSEKVGLDQIRTFERPNSIVQIFESSNSFSLYTQQ